MTRNKIPAPKHPKAILFMDAKGFSKLKNRDLFVYYDVLRDIAEILKKYPLNIDIYTANTWGDGLIVVFNCPAKAALCALDLKSYFDCGENFEAYRLPKMEARIGLHYEKIYKERNAITRRKDVVGEGVNTAARIEPIVHPGYIYCSEAFCNVLAEESKHAGQNDVSSNSRKGINHLKIDGVDVIVKKLRGERELAKGFGKMNLYYIYKDISKQKAPNDKKWAVRNQFYFNLSVQKVFSGCDTTIRVSELNDIFCSYMQYILHSQTDFKKEYSRADGIIKVHDLRISTFFAFSDGKKILLYCRDEESDRSNETTVRNHGMDVFGSQPFANDSLKKKLGDNFYNTVSVDIDNIHFIHGVAVEDNNDENNEKQIETVAMYGYIKEEDIKKYINDARRVTIPIETLDYDRAIIAKKYYPLTAKVRLAVEAIKALAQ